jgi:hypothetical protein
LLTPTIISGLQVYFDRSLGANLLYRFERPQFADVRKQYKTGQKVIIGQEKEVSAVYGAEHLLRMLGLSTSVLSLDTLLIIFVQVSLPGMIANSSLDPESVGLVRDYVNELLSCVTSFTCRVNKLIMPATDGWLRNGPAFSKPSMKTPTFNTRTYLGHEWLWLRDDWPPVCLMVVLFSVHFSPFFITLLSFSLCLPISSN